MQFVQNVPFSASRFSLSHLFSRSSNRKRPISPKKNKPIIVPNTIPRVGHTTKPDPTEETGEFLRVPRGGPYQEPHEPWGNDRGYTRRDDQPNVAFSEPLTLIHRTTCSRNGN